MLTPSSYRRSNVVKQTKEIREIGRSLACETRLDFQKQLEGKEAWWRSSVNGFNTNSGKL